MFRDLPIGRLVSYFISLKPLSKYLWYCMICGTKMTSAVMHTQWAWSLHIDIKLTPFMHQFDMQKNIKIINVRMNDCTIVKSYWLLGGTSPRHYAFCQFHVNVISWSVWSLIHVTWDIGTPHWQSKWVRLQVHILLSFNAHESMIGFAIVPNHLVVGI